VPEEDSERAVVRRREHFRLGCTLPDSAICRDPMQIRELTIERFRGIRSLTWRPASNVVCLVGPGDSTKTTILDAIELVLGSRWAVSVTDTDFHGADTADPLTIRATIGQLPAALISEDKYGLEIQGWHSTDGLHDEPEPADEAVLTVLFSVDDSLEPSWRIINDRRPEGRPFPSRDRELLGLIRLGGEIDRHLSWSRGSALSRNTDDVKEVNRVIASAQREARDAVAEAPLEKLKAAATKAERAATKLGVRVTSPYRPALDPASFSVGVGQLTLHHGDIPLRAAGLGSRRLNALALQTLSVQSGAVLLVDEVEHGLEPHRLRHLLRELQKAPGTTGQVFLTTHSEIPLEELNAGHLHVVRCTDGATTVHHVGPRLQAIARSNPEALLSRRVLVCEGKTEIGICIALCDFWATSHAGVPVAHSGTTFALGGGTSSGERARAFSTLGYMTALFGDSDKPPKPPEAELIAAGISVFLWSGGVSTEARIARDLPWEGLQDMVLIATGIVDQQSVLDAIGDRLPERPSLTSVLIDEWLTAGASEDDIRAAVGLAAHSKGWFKDIARGEELGAIVATALPSIKGSALAQTLKRIGNWIYAD
jgi:AAA domain, putative AbiEii toxin, Type IV TA system